METASIGKKAVILVLILVFFLVILLVYLSYKRSISEKTPTAVDSTKSLIDTAGTGEQMVPLGLSEDELWPSEEAGIERFQVAGTLVEKPYLNQEGFVVLNIEAMVGDNKKIVQINAGALEGKSAKPQVALNKVGKIGDPNPSSASVIVDLKDLSEDEALANGVSVVVQFLFSNSKEKITQYYQNDLPKSGACRGDCLDLLVKIRANSEVSFGAFDYLSGATQEEALVLFVFATNIYVQN